MARPGSRARKHLKNVKEVLPLPNLIEIQLNSFQWFVTEGLTELFAEINPIEDFTGTTNAAPVGPIPPSNKAVNVDSHAGGFP